MAKTAESVVDIILEIPEEAPSVMAFGAYLKNTVSVFHDGKAYVSRPIGDLGTPDAVADFEQVIDALLLETGARPRCVAHDLHPDFYSTRYAQEFGLPTLPVQHHHAHIGGLALEHGLEEPVLGIAFDGFGLGPDAQAWGGEMLLVDGADYTRVGHLSLLAQPGGDIAAREPWRMGASVLHRLGRGGEIAARFSDQAMAPMLDQVLSKGINAPMTSSAGRLFDAACGLLGVHPVTEFEGQAPMALERLVTTPKIMSDGWTISDDGELDCLPLLAALDGLDAAEGANLFHGTLATAVLDWIAWGRRKTGVQTVAFGGGCFLNKVLSNLLAQQLRDTAYFPDICSAGDPVISLGQAWVAARAECEE